LAFRERLAGWAEDLELFAEYLLRHNATGEFAREAAPAGD
jgi:hypothetical protein